MFPLLLITVLCPGLLIMLCTWLTVGGVLLLMAWLSGLSLSRGGATSPVGQVFT